MYYNLLILHITAVVVLIVYYVARLIAAFRFEPTFFQKIKTATWIIEVILFGVVLVSGIWMLYLYKEYQQATIGIPLIIKISLSIVTLPLLWVWQKTEKKQFSLAVFLVICIALISYVGTVMKKGKVIATPQFIEPLALGKEIYQTSCVSCHGTDGKLCLNKACDLSTNKLTPKEQWKAIRNGTNEMPAYPELRVMKGLTDTEIDAVVLYITTLKTTTPSDTSQM
jgi:cytochrome c553